MSIEKYPVTISHDFQKCLKYGSTASICFDCQRAVAKCPWSEIDPKTDKPRFQPVEGWTAEPSSISEDNCRVLDCPLFLPDEPRVPKEQGCKAASMTAMTNKPKNPYREGSMIWSVMEGDWEDLTVDQIAEVLGFDRLLVRKYLSRIKCETGYEVPHKPFKRKEG